MVKQEFERLFFSHIKSDLPFITEEILIGKSKKIKRREKEVKVKDGCFFIERNYLIVGVAFFFNDIEQVRSQIMFRKGRRKQRKPKYDFEGFSSKIKDVFSFEKSTY